MDANDLVIENARRRAEKFCTFNPLTGEGSLGERKAVSIPDFPIPTQHLPAEMMRETFIRQIVKCGGVGQYIERHEPLATPEMIVDTFTRLRCKYDFPYWAFAYVRIKNKLGGEDIPFRLNRPQRRLIGRYEQMRKAGLPIRVILLKARQWGGSTATQIYFAWLQMIHMSGLNSLIVAHVKDTSVEILDMFNRLITNYPTAMLYPIGASVPSGVPSLAGVMEAQNIHRLAERNCKIKIGTAERPDSARGGDYQLVHCSEVAFWKKTDGKTPEAIVRSACSGVLNRPMTMIVYESTANGTGNFFHREWVDAKHGKGAFSPLFISWFEIENNETPLEDELAFAQWLFDNRDNDNVSSVREEPGTFLWRLWNMGATLEAIHWYVEERKKYTDHADFAAECPTDDIEAFKHSGQMQFDINQIEAFESACRPPKHIGAVYADSDKGEDALTNLRFSEDRQGQLWIWDMPEISGTEKVTDRYLTVVDIGGRSAKADWSVIVVFDRYWMIEGDKPCVVAQWYGHIDMDLLAWEAARIAAFYDNSLLVIESNTLETKDRDRVVDGNQAPFILNQIKNVYPNLYARTQSEEDIAEGRPVRYGFHTNVGNKPTLISNLVKCVRERLWVERDERMLHELRVYERKENGSFGAVAGEHDDLLMTRAIGLFICFREMDVPRIVSRDDRMLSGTQTINEATLL